MLTRPLRLTPVIGPCDAIWAHASAVKSSSVIPDESVITTMPRVAFVEREGSEVATIDDLNDGRESWMLLAAMRASDAAMSAPSNRATTTAWIICIVCSSVDYSEATRGMFLEGVMPTIPTSSAQCLPHCNAHGPPGQGGVAVGSSEDLGRNIVHRFCDESWADVKDR